MTAGLSKPVKLRHLKIYSIASVGGVVAFSILAILAKKFEVMGEMTLKSYSNAAIGVIGGITFIGIALAHYVYRRKTGALRNSAVVGQEKLNQYRYALGRYLAIVEIPAIIANVQFLMSKNYWPLTFVALVIAAMIHKFPTRQKVIADAGLDWQEQDLLK